MKGGTWLYALEVDWTMKVFSIGWENQGEELKYKRAWWHHMKMKVTLKKDFWKKKYIYRWIVNNKSRTFELILIILTLI